MSSSKGIEPQYTLFEELDQFEEVVNRDDPLSLIDNNSDQPVAAPSDLNLTSIQEDSNEIDQFEEVVNSDDPLSFTDNNPDQPVAAPSDLNLTSIKQDSNDIMKMDEVSNEEELCDSFIGINGDQENDKEPENNELTEIIDDVNSTFKIERENKAPSDEHESTSSCNLDSKEKQAILNIRSALDNENIKHDDNQSESHLLTELERREAERKKSGGKNHGYKKNGKKRNRITSRYVIPNVKEVGNEETVADEAEFNWEDYLEETGTIAAPPTAFVHVEHSLENGFKESMMLEVLHNAEQSHYWYATIMMTCGPLLSLRYLGNENDKSKDFWCDINTQEVHPIGWCKDNNLQIVCPPNIIEESEGWEENLLAKANASLSPPSSVFENGMTPIDQIKQGLKLEVQALLQPDKTWFATVIENVGGRLLLRYHGFHDASHDFWLFYLSWRLHPIGWAKKNNYSYCPPEEISSSYLEASCDKVLLSISELEMVPAETFCNQILPPMHEFKVGMKMEMLSPVDHLHIIPATVTDVINNWYFLLQLDNYTEKKSDVKYCRHSGSWDIFHPMWAKANGLKVQLPKGLNIPTNITRSLDWEEYLKHTNSVAAPVSCFPSKMDEDFYHFEKEMRLEAVNPFQPHQLCAASITKVASHLLWIQLDSVDAFNVHHVTSAKSHDIFPVGWCESNNYSLKPPRRWFSKRQRKLLAKKTHDSESVQPPDLIGSEKGELCPEIYINHRCFSGRFLSKSKLSELPRSIGPGTVQLVLKQVISLLISTAYIPTRVHKELQLNGMSNANMTQQIMKAKYKEKTRRGVIEIARTADQVEDFCKNICLKLECCPYLFGPTFVSNVCPKLCHKLTKTQFNLPGSIAKKSKRLWRPTKNVTSNEDGKIEAREDSEKSDFSDEPPAKAKKASGKNPDQGKHYLESSEKPKAHHRKKTTNITEVPETGDVTLPKIIDVPKLSSNPIHWSVEEVAKYFEDTDCAWLIPQFRDQEMDGIAILLMNLAIVREYFQLKLGPAVKFCKHVEKLKTAFYLQYAS